MGLSGQLEKSLGITGGTDQTDIGNVGDRLKVDSAAVVVPQTDLIYRVVSLQRTSDNQKAMNVDGSTTTQHFDFVPGSGETWYIEEITIFIIDQGPTTATNFGAISALTNGCILLITSSGIDYTIFNDLKNNTDFLLYFGNYPYVTPVVGFMEQSDTYKGTLQFNYPAQISGTGDKVRFSVRDNLSSIDNFQMSVKMWREK